MSNKTSMFLAQLKRYNSEAYGVNANLAYKLAVKIDPLPGDVVPPETVDAIISQMRHNTMNKSR